MTQADALQLLQSAIWVTMLVAGPIVVAAMAVGIIVAVLQALTQVQELTLTFVPKIIVTFVIMALMASFAGTVFGSFTEEVYGHIERGYKG